MYNGIKKALGPTHSKAEHLKSATGEIIADRAKHIKCWIEHYSELYLNMNTIVQSALDAIKLCQQWMTETLSQLWMSSARSLII